MRHIYFPFLIAFAFFNSSLHGQCDQFDLQIEFCQDEMSLDLTIYEASADGVYTYFQAGVLIDDPVNYMPDSTLTVTGVYTEVNCVDTFDIIIDVVIIPETNFLETYEINCNNPTITLDVGFSEDLLLDYLWIDPAGNIFAADQIATLSNTGIYVLTIQHLIFSCFADTEIEVINGFTIPEPLAIELVQNCDSTATLIASPESANIAIDWVGPGIVGATNEYEILIDTPGEYIHVLTDVVSGCSNAAVVYQVDSIGCMDSPIAEFSEIEPLLLIPNPTEGPVQVKYSEPIGDIWIMDHLGRKVLEKSGSQREFDLSALPEGVYIVGVEIGTVVVWRKLMKR